MKEKQTDLSLWTLVLGILLLASICLIYQQQTHIDRLNEELIEMEQLHVALSDSYNE